MVSFQMAREFRVDGQRRLYADNHITGLVCDSRNCGQSVLLVYKFNATIEAVCCGGARMSGRRLGTEE